jgi:hypothetical protein
VNEPTDIRMYKALQKLKGVVKFTQDSTGKVREVGVRAAGIAEAMRKAREPIVSLLQKPAQKSRAHLKVVK